MNSDSTTSARGQNPFTSKFDDVVAKAQGRWKFPGLAIAVVDRSETFTKHARHPGHTGDDVPRCQHHQSFSCRGSISLVDDEGKHKDIKWTTPISHLIRDDFVLRDAYWTEHISIEDALCHRTGFPRHDKCCIGTGTTVRENVRKLRHLPPARDREPRTVSDYCNTMFIAVSFAVEVATGQYLGDFLAERIWKPLGMDSTYFSLKAAQESGKPFAKGYFWDEEKKEWTLIPYIDLSDASGTGVNITNVVDYAKWVRAMIKMEGPISKKGHAELVKPRIPFDIGLPESFPTVFYGLGWIILWFFGEKVIFHPGGIYGFSAMVVYLPRREWGCVMLANSQYAGPALHSLMWYMISELLGIPESQRVNFDEIFEKQKEEAVSRSANARQHLFPDAAADIPPSLPLQAYAGTYTHAAYPTLTLELKDNKLHADVIDRQWPFHIEFEHISGEHFIARTSHFSVDVDEVVQAEFYVNAKGKAEMLKIKFEEVTDMIEFVRT